MVVNVEDESPSDTNEEPFISIIDAFQVPRFVFNQETEKYVKTPNQALLGEFQEPLLRATRAMTNH